MASWRSGDAADCKSVYTGSIPVLASRFLIPFKHWNSYKIKAFLVFGLYGTLYGLRVNLYELCYIDYGDPRRGGAPSTPRRVTGGGGRNKGGLVTKKSK